MSTYILCFTCEHSEKWKTRVKFRRCGIKKSDSDLMLLLSCRSSRYRCDREIAEEVRGGDETFVLMTSNIYRQLQQLHQYKGRLLVKTGRNPPNTDAHTTTTWRHVQLSIKYISEISIRTCQVWATKNWDVPRWSGTRWFNDLWGSKRFFFPRHSLVFVLLKLALDSNPTTLKDFEGLNLTSLESPPFKLTEIPKR